MDNMEEKLPNFTTISAGAWNDLSDAEMTADRAIAYLQEDFPLRSFWEMLTQLYPQPDLREKLAAALCAYSDLSRDSVRRKIALWEKGTYMPTERSELYRICFALELDEIKSNSLFQSCSESLIHYRDPDEVVFVFCLRNGIPYPEALEIQAQVHALGHRSESSAEAGYTKLLRDELQTVRSVDSLIQYFQKNIEKMGSFHRTAYEVFKKGIDTLMMPDTAIGSAEKKYSLEEIADIYLRFGMPSEKNTQQYSTIQKLLKKHWPNRTMIKNMYSRTIDVNRKTLLLLYLITDGLQEDDGEYAEFEEDYITPAERMEQHYWRINLMLDACGMSRLDVRSPFDWLVLYALKTDTDEDSDQKIQQAIRKLFGGNELDG